MIETMLNKNNLLKYFQVEQLIQRVMLNIYRILIQSILKRIYTLWTWKNEKLNINYFKGFGCAHLFYYRS